MEAPRAGDTIAVLANAPHDDRRYERVKRFRDPFAPEPWARKVRQAAPPMKRDAGVVKALESALLRGDPEADALVLWMRKVGAKEGHAAFEMALEHGIDAVPSPSEPLKRFFAAVDAVPVWLDRDQLERACRVLDRTSIAGEYVLFTALLGGYVSAGITKTLVRTGDLTRSATRRLAETVKFVHDITRSRVMARESDGFKSTVRVRLMHAHVRTNLLAKGWDVERWGVPVNQADMAGTLVQFSSAYVAGVRALGFLVSRREREAIAHLWRYVGRLLGVEDSLVPATDAEGLKLLHLTIASQEGPDEDGRTLAAALLAVPPIRNRGHYPEWLSAMDVGFRAGLTRLAVGSLAADKLDLPDTLWKHAPFFVVPIVFCAERLRALVPGATLLAERFARKITARRSARWLGGEPAKFAPAERSLP